MKCLSDILVNVALVALAAMFGLMLVTVWRPHSLAYGYAGVVAGVLFALAYGVDFVRTLKGGE